MDRESERVIRFNVFVSTLELYRSYPSYSYINIVVPLLLIHRALGRHYIVRFQYFEVILHKGVLYWQFLLNRGYIATYMWPLLSLYTI